MSEELITSFKAFVGQVVSLKLVTLAFATQAEVRSFLKRYKYLLCNLVFFSKLKSRICSCHVTWPCVKDGCFRFTCTFHFFFLMVGLVKSMSSTGATTSWRTRIMRKNHVTIFWAVKNRL